MNAISQPAPGHSGEGNRSSLLAELGAVVIIFSASLAAFPLSEVPKGGLLEHLYPLLRMGGLLLLLTWLLRRHGKSWRELGLRRPDGWLRAISVTVGGYVVIVGVLALLLVPALRAAGLPAGEQPEAFAYLRGNLPELLYWITLSWLSAAFGEELLARGYLMNRLELLIGGSERMRAAAAVFGQALIFGLWHAWNGPSGMILAGTIGLMLGLVYLAAGRNLWPGIVIHGIIDTQSFTAIYLGLIPTAG